MSQKLSVNGFKWKRIIPKFNEDFIKNYDEESNKGYVIEVDVEYQKALHNLHSGLQFLPEKMKIKLCSKLVCNLYDKKLCCSHKGFKRSIKSWIRAKQVHRVIQFNQKAWLKKYIDMNTKLSKEVKHDFEKDLCKHLFIE